MRLSMHELGQQAHLLQSQLEIERAKAQNLPVAPLVPTGGPEVERGGPSTSGLGAAAGSGTAMGGAEAGTAEEDGIGTTGAGAAGGGSGGGGGAASIIPGLGLTAQHVELLVKQQSPRMGGPDLSDPEVVQLLPVALKIAQMQRNTAEAKVWLGSAMLWGGVSPRLGLWFGALAVAVE